MSDPILILSEVVEITRVPAATLRYWRHLADGSGPRSFKIGRRVMYKQSDVDTWLDQQYAATDLRSAS